MTNIVVFGGGTGTGPVVRELRHRANITVVVPSTDRGGSSGGLMQNGITELPPGDAIKATIALSDVQEELAELLSYRFPKSSEKLGGDSLANLAVGAAQGLRNGDFSLGLKFLGKVFGIKGQVLPSTLERDTDLCVVRADGQEVCGEKDIDEQDEAGMPEIVKAYLTRPAAINPEVALACAEADLFVFAPGSFYTSFVPIMLVDGIADALAKSSAKKILITNLVSEPGHTDDWTAHRYAEMAERYIAPSKLTVVLANDPAIQPREELLKRYLQKGSHLVELGRPAPDATYDLRVANLLSKDVVEPSPNDPVKDRAVFRHDPSKIATRLEIETES